MAGTRAHTDSEKAKAVGLALLRGTAAAAEASGVSQRTVQRWVDDPAMARLVAETKDGVRDHIWAGMQIGLEAVVAGLKDPDAPLQARANTFGILFDKWALMSGEATSRSESKDITDDIPLSVKRQLRSRFADLAGDPGDGVAAEGAHGAAATEG